MQTTSRTKRYVLVDFSCSNYFTHHASYLRSYAEFLSDLGCDVEIWINNAASTEVRAYLERYQVKAILDSPDYGNTMDSNFLRYLRDKMFGVCLKFLDSFASHKLSEVVREKFARIYFSKAFSELVRRGNSGEEIHLVFPSVDGIGIRFLRYCLGRELGEIGFSIRVINSHSRGLLGVKNALTVFSKLIAEDKKQKLFIGYETDAVRIEFSELLPSSRLIWAPIPPTHQQFTRNSHAACVLGFIGSARENKGFDTIPDILQILQDNKIDYTAIIQLANFEWPRYQETYNLLKGFSDNVTFLPGGCSEIVLQEALRNVDFLILPYKLENYRLAGSGLLYQAADLSVPILASAGVGFEWDLLNFAIGAVFQDYNELPSLISNYKFSGDELPVAFKRYARARAQASEKFVKVVS